jgi:hypothetical protein
MKKSRMAACSGKNANHGFFCKIFLGKIGFWTNIFVHFPNPNHFLCFTQLYVQPCPFVQFCLDDTDCAASPRMRNSVIFS